MLEAAIVAHADEDTPRLAYADWLDEHGDPDRAAFIRAQCRLAEMPPDAPDWYELLEQESDLAARLHDRFPSLRPTPPERFYFGTYFPRTDEEPQFHRGFPFFIDYQSLGWTYREME
ncbi:MAG: TIGR02996 domain-containing protein [Planctomycetes bacterium]|nr:TIGR02996 domain-containing protein [Planctomycetota bacterium]